MPVMHLVINTHWDREWRWSLGETQVRLVEAMDLLLDTMEKDPRFKSFLADSQAAIVDDYIEKRPENRERIRQLVRAGRLCVGPWYTLPALFLVSGESIVRNLLIGHRLAAEAGGVMKAAYNVFSWGQVSQLPQIYRQFGMDTIMFYRGLDQSAAERFEYHWEGPDGSRLLGIGFGRANRLNFWSMVYQPWRRGTGRPICDRTGSVGFLTNVCDPTSAETNHRVVDRPNAKDLDAALRGLAELRGTLEPKSSTEHLLFLQGTDLDIPDPEVVELVEQLNAKLGGERIEISSMPAFFAGVRKSLEAQKLIEKLPVLRGERLDVHSTDPAGTALLAGVYSARMNVKLANHRAQTCLESWAEPAASWAWLLGAAYPRAFLDAAWKALCQNQQHDGVGGCHVDRVTLATEERYRTVEDIGETVTRNALSGIAAKVEASHLAPNEVGLVVFNPHARPHSGVAECFADFPHELIGQKPGGYRQPGSVELRDAQGREVECQVLEFDDRLVSARMPVAGGEKFPAVRFRLAFETGELPSMGFRGYTARFVPREYRPTATLSPRANVLENEHLRAAVNGDGTVDLLDKASGQEFPGLGYFEDGGEEGGPLMHVVPKRDAVFTTLGQPAAVSLVTAGPVVSVYRIEREWSLPECLEAVLDVHIPNLARFIETQRPGRSERRAALRIVTEMSLEKGSRRLEFRTRVWNAVRDHRLRVVFPTGVGADVHSADSPFDIVERPVARPDSRGWHEEALRTWPSQGFVDLSGGAGRALAVLHAGIPEYEVSGDETRSVALTLLRSFGAAGGVADTYAPQPLAQVPGEHEFRYAVHPHAGDCRAARVWREAVGFTVPLRVVQCTAHRGELAFAGVSFASVDCEDLVVTALKQSEDGRALVLRCFNPTRKALKAAVRLSRAVARAQSVTLEERPLAELAVSGGAVPIAAAPGQIVSIRMEVAK